MTEPLFGVDRSPRVLAPGAVHVPGWMDRRRQEFLLRACADWAARCTPRTVTLPGGGRMTVRTLELGRRWEPYRYLDDAGVPPVPDWLVRAGREALAAAASVDPLVLGSGPERTESEGYAPDVALVNLYGPGSSMGLHRDRDERCADPVVSLSLGDEALFRFGGSEHRGPPYVDVRLASGDLVVFGGPARQAYHGVPRVDDGTAPAWCAEVLGGRPGRVNLTLRRSR